ncbi:GTP-binding protein [Coemansia sp. S146]|nr:GTP-binding protein [Coemansia sp. S146]
MSNSRLDRNIVILGGVGVGKSSVITRFIKGEYSEKYVPTVSGFHSKKFKVDEKEYNLSISDTTGQDESSLLDSSHIGSTDVFLIAFSVNNRRSYVIAQVVREKILEQAGVDSVGIVLVGNKCDLKDERQVSTKEVQELAAKFGCPYVETSSREGTNVDELFTVATRVANKSRGGSSDEEVGKTTDKPAMFQWIRNMWYFS